MEACKSVHQQEISGSNTHWSKKTICWLDSRVDFCSFSFLQVVVEIKSKHVVGAFSMKSKG